MTLSVTASAPGKAMDNSTGRFNFHGRVAVVHSNQSTRSLFVRTLRQKGFADIQTFADLKSLVEHMEVEPFDWIWTPFNQEDQINALHILELCCAEDLLASTRISVTFSKETAMYVATCFELGMLSWHPDPKTGAEVETEVNKIITLLSRHDRICALASAQMLDPLLHKSQASEQRRRLFQNLADLYPNSPYAVLKHAEIELEGGHESSGIRALKLAQKQNFPGWEELARRHLGDNAEFDASRLFDIQSYVIVEPDESIQNHIEELMRPFGVKKVFRFTDGEKALKWLASGKKPDLIIQEWKLPKIAGASFLQRVRQTIEGDTPVLIVSSLLKKADIPLLKEMGIATAVQKPLIDHEFLSSLTKTMSEYTDPHSVRFVIRKMRTLFECNERGAALQLLRKAETDPKFPVSSLEVMKGLKCFFLSDYLMARRHYERALESGAEPLDVLPLLARTMVHLRDFVSASRCYERAHNLSPKNVYRLVELAEVYSELGETEQSADSLSKAEQLDPGNPEAKTMRVRHALWRGDLEEAQQACKHLSDKSHLVADLNNTGVAYVQTGKINEGIQFYTNTLKLLDSSGDQELQIRVTYNLALAQAKRGDYAGATRQLEFSLRRLRESQYTEASLGELKKKVQMLLTRVTTAYLTGTPLQFPQKKAAHDIHCNQSFWKRLENIQPRNEFRCSPGARPGQRSCHLLFRNQNHNRSKLKLSQLLQSKLEFNPRASIHKCSSAMSELHQTEPPGNLIDA